MSCVSTSAASSAVGASESFPFPPRPPRRSPPLLSCSSSSRRRSRGAGGGERDLPRGDRDGDFDSL